MFSLLVETVSCVLEEKLVRFEIYHSIVHSLKFLYFIAKLMLTNSLEVETLLASEGQFDGRFPEDSSRFDMTILESFICLVIILRINDFQMCSRNVSGMFSDSCQLDVFEFKVFLQVFLQFCQVTTS